MFKAWRFPKIGLSTRLILVLVGAVLLGPVIPKSLKAVLYASSLSIKELLLFVLPVVVFICVFSALLSFQGGKALKFIVGLFAVVCVSNFTATWIAYGVGSLKLIALKTTVTHIDPALELHPAWNIHFPQWLSNSQVLILGFLAGIFFAFYPTTWAKQLSDAAKRFITTVLEKTFIPILPLFILGFILKIQQEGTLKPLLGSYLQLLLLITSTYVLYLTILFVLAAQFNLKRLGIYLKNIGPVALTAFSTMSSLATMPLTLKAAQKNTGDLTIPEAVIPALVNVHMIGVSLGIPLMALCLLSTFGYTLPSGLIYLKFAAYFVLAQFSVAGVPCGAIFVMLPLLEAHLGFSPEMIGLITALYIIFNPVLTTTNVLGNSAVVIFCARLFRKFVFLPKIQ